jgi:hypothetical protein
MKYYDNPKGMIPTWLINWCAKVSMIYYLYSGLVCVALFKVLLLQALVTIAKFGYPHLFLGLLVLLLPKIIWFSDLSTLSIPDEGYSRNVLLTLNLMSTFLLCLHNVPAPTFLKLLNYAYCNFEDLFCFHDIVEKGLK